MRPSDVLAHATRYLERHDIESPRATAEVLLLHVLGIDRAALYARAEGLTSAEAKTFGRALCQRCTGTPVQHLTGRQAFRRLDLEVRGGVFVPRPETEVVVDVALEMLGELEAPRVIDVGTGTGAVALAIAEERPGSRVIATDRSPEAVALASSNVIRLGLDVTVLEGDLLDPVADALRGDVDLIVSNPPYVDPAELEDLPLVVRADPELALVGGTEFHRRLVDVGPRWLRSGGSMVVEIGSTQAAEVASVFAHGGFGAVEVRQDLTGRDRVVAGRLRD